MATRDEHPERYGWWLNELESLGIKYKENELNDLNEIRPDREFKTRFI